MFSTDLIHVLSSSRKALQFPTPVDFRMCFPGPGCAVGLAGPQLQLCSFITSSACTSRGWARAWPWKSSLATWNHSLGNPPGLALGLTCVIKALFGTEVSVIKS